MSFNIVTCGRNSSQKAYFSGIFKGFSIKIRPGRTWSNLSQPHSIYCSYTPSWKYKTARRRRAENAPRRRADLTTKSRFSCSPPRSATHNNQVSNIGRVSTQLSFEHLDYLTSVPFSSLRTGSLASVLLNPATTQFLPVAAHASSISASCRFFFISSLSAKSPS